MRGYPEFSFWISITLVKAYSRIFSKSRKNTFELVGTVLKFRQESMEVREVILHIGPVSKRSKKT